MPKVVNPEFLTANNQHKTDQDNDGQDDYLYDVSGNLTKDAQSRNFTYDGENRQLTAIGTDLSMSYAYDGNGKRVKTFNAVTNQTTIFVYDAENDLAAEYTINTPAPQNPTISYLTEDALGSVRVTTDSSGQIKVRRDFLPFGEELYANIGNRTTNQKYSANSDDTRKKFATYQRDVETGLDFAQSRYYSPMQGRFTSPNENRLQIFITDALPNGQFILVSNPYRAATSTAATAEESMGWTRSKSINTGKHSEVETFTGASLPAPWGNNTASTGKMQTDVDTDRTLVTDQAGKRRISQTNALGQLINVWEIKESDSDTEAVSFATDSGIVALNGLKTSYQYNTLGKMIEVTQGVQNRYFLYNSLADF